jgi:hypothetical protein
MVSQRKRLANRMNARKSTGPRTARGKAIVSRNAVTHGLTVRAGPVLAGESELDYEAFADAMRRDLRPVGVLQRELVEHMTQICWKLRRIPSIEAVLLDHQMHCIEREFAREKEQGEIDPDATPPQASAAVLLAAQFSLEGERSCERLELYRVRLERGLHAAQRHLRKLREETAGEEIDGEHEGFCMLAEIRQFHAQRKAIADAHAPGENSPDASEEENPAGQNKPTAAGNAGGP